MNAFISSGGVGDSLIVCLKILQWKRLHPNKEVVYYHYEKHRCHKKPIDQIIGEFIGDGECYIVDKPEIMAKNTVKTMKASSGLIKKVLQKDNDVMYLNTRIENISYPYLYEGIKGKSLFKEPYICVQSAAGRMGDSTKRIITPDAIRQILEFFSHFKVVVLGPKQNIFKDRNLINYSGRTDSIIDAFKIINNCYAFIGLDGVLAYYAAMIKKSSIIHYHIPTLLNHYFNPMWKSHVIPYIGTHNLSNIRIEGLQKLKQIMFGET